MEAQDLFTGLKKGDAESIKRIYVEIFPDVKTWVINNNGNSADAYDLFHESLENILLKIDEVQSSFEGLVIRMCKNKWIDKLRREGRNQKYLDQIDASETKSESIHQSIEKSEREYYKHKLMERTFVQLSYICQELLVLIRKGNKTESILDQMNFSNANSMYRRKAACIERWSSLVRVDPEYKMTQHD